MGIPSLLMTVFCLLYEKMLNAGMGNKFEFDKEIIMIPISDILIRSISGYVFMVPVFVLYFLWLKKLGRTQSFLHTAAVFVFGYYLFGLLTVTGIGFTSTMTFRPNISWTPFIGMITGPIDTILNIILFVPLGFFLPLLYKKYHHMKTVALTGFLFSLAVEIVQMFGWGSSDINDLMTNTAGACIGFLVYCLLSRILPANLKKQLQSSRVNAVAEVLLFAICTFAIMVTAQTWFVHDVLNVLPDGIAIGPVNEDALYGGVVDQLCLFAHIGVPLGKIDLHIGDLLDFLFFRHINSSFRKYFSVNRFILSHLSSVCT